MRKRRQQHSCRLARGLWSWQDAALGVACHACGEPQWGKDIIARLCATVCGKGLASPLAGRSESDRLTPQRSSTAGAEISHKLPSFSLGHSGALCQTCYRSIDRAPPPHTSLPAAPEGLPNTERLKKIPLFPSRSNPATLALCFCTPSPKTALSRSAIFLRKMGLGPRSEKLIIAIVGRVLG